MNARPATTPTYIDYAGERQQILKQVGTVEVRKISSSLMGMRHYLCTETGNAICLLPDEEIYLDAGRFVNFRPLHHQGRDGNFRPDFELAFDYSFSVDKMDTRWLDALGKMMCPWSLNAISMPKSVCPRLTVTLPSDRDAVEFRLRMS